MMVVESAIRGLNAQNVGRYFTTKTPTVINVTVSIKTVC